MSDDPNEKWDETWGRAKRDGYEPLTPPEMFNDIKEFHEKFGLEYVGKPQLLVHELAVFRTLFLEEELMEYANCSDAGDLAGQLDALVDLVYVALGTAYLHGFNFNEAWRRVHAANMKKVRASDASESKRDSIHDVVKPEGWEAPDLSDLVK